MTAPDDFSRLPAGWRTELETLGFDVSRLYEAIDRRYGPGDAVISPSKRDLFRAFHLTPLSEVRVVLLAQDPYPRGSLADGLAFSQRGPVDPTSSLARLLDNLATDPKVGFSRPDSGDLTPWARRGVLLVNEALTVTGGAAGSDLEFWREFTRSVLILARRRNPALVFLCFGRPALNALTRAGASSQQIVVTAHPAARDLTGSDLRRLQDSRPFSEVNAVLRQKGADEIDWRL